MALSLLRPRLCSVVAPPFMYGNRHPEITGLIRVNEEISPIARNVLFEKYLKNIPSIHAEHVDLIEVVTDNCMALQANYIQSGAGILLKSTVAVGQARVPCAIGFGFEGIGEFNSRKNFHAIQARTVVQSKVEEFLQTTGGLGVMHDPEGAIHELEAGIPSVKTESVDGMKNANLELISPEECKELFHQYCVFPTTHPVYGMVQGETLVAGASIRSHRHRDVLINPFVTTDCEPGQEKAAFQRLAALIKKELGVSPQSLRFMASDRCMNTIFPDAIVAESYSASCIGLHLQTETAISRYPWTTLPIYS